jgi:hypothetical protein
MPPVRHAALIGLLALLLVPLPAGAESQSSNSSSNCSNGRCTRVDSLVVEDDRGRRGWVRHQAWRERDGQRWGGPARVQDLRGAPRRWQRDDDDDDDDD